MPKYEIKAPKEVPLVDTKYRKIKTKIPVPESVPLFESLQKYELNGIYAHELPIIWDKTDDFQVYDKWGNKWIDFTSGIFVANVGHCADGVSKAVADKLNNKLIHSYIFPNESRIKLIKKLCEITRMDKILLTVTGSEANDVAIQMMHRNKKGKILSIEGAYYGSTAVCRQLSENVIDESMDPDKFNPDEIAGVFLQTFRGRDANFMPYDWVKTWCKWAQENNIPIGFDEMQSGFARTGKWFGFQHYDIKPDFITVGKAFGGGLPISAVIGREKLLELADDLWSTHTGNPMCCAAALATLEIIESQNLVEKSAARDGWFGQLLRTTFPNNKIYGHGMIWGLYTGNPELTQKIIERCAEKGLLLVSTHGPAIKIGPPLTIPDEALSEGVKVLEESFKEIVNGINN
jgi:4-aminobutyrate aminotransferase/diaminobutyrate-pyruvate transaminase/4-aminobutyrate aminotransferase/(S)-3-amino-2-methylpropionate transaminase